MAESKLDSLARQLLEEIGFPSDPSDGSSWKDNAWRETYNECKARLPKKEADRCPAIGLPCARQDCDVRFFDKNNGGLHGGFEDGAFRKPGNRQKGK